MIAEGEGQLSGEVPVADASRRASTLDRAERRGDAASISRVPQTVVDKVFPTKDDLPLLAHVREVDINDTELAIGDDDGFLAVVLANRLPQFDRRRCAARCAISPA